MKGKIAVLTADSRREQYMGKLAALVLALLFSFCVHAQEENGNRLTYLDGSNPYYPHRSFPKLITPQWVGEREVEAVIVLSIDDAVTPKPFETYLRPTMDRLKEIDGRAPISLMCNQLNVTQEVVIQKMLTEGLSFETHTFGHPCPLLGKEGFAAAKREYDICVDWISEIPRNQPVAFRMPCCDSTNTLSPRFFAEIFNGATERGNTLAIDSSIFNLVTSKDLEIPGDLLFDTEGKGINSKYFPHPAWVNYIEDYPYPYVIGRLCWEFPCGTPTDFQASIVWGNSHPMILHDWKKMVDITVRKQGVLTLLFHLGRGWSGREQIRDLVDYAHKKYGEKIKFLNFREALIRLNHYLLSDISLRRSDGGDHGVRLLDLNGDGSLDVVIGNPQKRQTRVWDPKQGIWSNGKFPLAFYDIDDSGRKMDAGVRFGILGEDQAVIMLVRNERTMGGWTFRDGRWTKEDTLLDGLEIEGEPVLTSFEGRDRGVRLRDLDRDGQTELLVGNEKQRAAFRWDPAKEKWVRLPFALPEPTAVVDEGGYDRGLRFVDLNGDRAEDVLYSNETEYSLHLFTSMEKGWDRKIKEGEDGPGREIPMIVRGRTNNGAWFFQHNLILQNEDTAFMRANVDRRSFRELLAPKK